MFMHILTDHQFQSIQQSIAALQSALAGAQTVQLDLTTTKTKAESQPKTHKSKPKAKTKGKRGRGVAALNETKVIEIKRQLASGTKSASQIARDFGVHLTTINCIKWNKTWKHVEIPADDAVVSAAEVAAV